MAIKYFYGNVSIAAGTETELKNENKVYNENVIILELNNGNSRFKIGDGNNTYINLPYVTGFTLSKEQLEYIEKIGESGGFVKINEDGKIDETYIPDIFIKKNSIIFLNCGDASNAQFMSDKFSS